MNITCLRAKLQTAFIGCQIEHHMQVASTNDIAIARGKAGAAEGTLIIAEHQTAGRGRYGRKMGGTTRKVSTRVSCT